MLGHRLCRVWNKTYEVWATYRKAADCYQQYQMLDCNHQLGGIEVGNISRIASIIKKLSPNVVINAIGMVKQRPEGKKRHTAIMINALFPHYLADLCENFSSRMIHISTDCVFSGRKGQYVETDIPDPVDDYGMCKVLGEVLRPNVLTLRTSMIGWELENRIGLMEWFAAQRGKTIQGYRNAIFSGFTTQAMAALLGELITKQPGLNGLYHLSSEPISKFQLLEMCQSRLGWFDIDLQPQDQFVIDRSLNGKRLNDMMEWHLPNWQTMLDDLCRDWCWYARYRQVN